MKIETKTNKKTGVACTQITAEEGKLLRRKWDGHIVGTTVSLGYVYYSITDKIMEVEREVEVINDFGVPSMVRKKVKEIESTQHLLEEPVLEEPEHYEEIDNFLNNN